MQDVINTVAAQYANSPTLRQLIDNMNEYFDPATDFEAFYSYVWNVDTAQGFGLDILGRIVNVSRQLTIPGDVDYFGFDEATDANPFDQEPFYNGDQSSQTYTLADDAYRTLILAKALSNISASTAPSINALLQSLFPRGRCYVLDLGGMAIKFVFEFQLEPFERAILTQSGVIPRPAGVSYTIFEVATESTFGFAQSLTAQPFGQGAFFRGA